MWKRVLAEQALCNLKRRLEMLVVGSMTVVEALVGEHIASAMAEEEESGRRVEEGMARIAGDEEHSGTEVGEVVGRSSRRTAACRCCTSAAGTGDGDVGCIVFFFLYLAACLALPADDGHSSCRRG